jgi:hypothetical protein
MLVAGSPLFDLVERGTQLAAELSYLGARLDDRTKKIVRVGVCVGLARRCVPVELDVLLNFAARVVVVVGDVVVVVDDVVVVVGDVVVVVGDVVVVVGDVVVVVGDVVVVVLV